MTKLMAFATRNFKELIRDKLNLAFQIGFPVILLLLLSMIQANIPVDLFGIARLAPGVAVFGLSFITLFAALLISKDRTSSFMLRLFTSPMSSAHFLLGYTLPLVPMAIAQAALCFIVSFLLGLKVSVNVLMTLVVMLPAIVFYIAQGLLFGSLLNDKAVGGFCGALLTNLSAWLSGVWFDVTLVGGAFEQIANLLPYIHAVNACRAAMNGQWQSIFPDLWWVIGYAVVIMTIAVWAFMRQMKRDAR